jgi:hypothetical protein
MGFWTTAQRAAAHEFGRRHYRGIIGIEVARRLAPVLLLGAAAAGVVWALAKGWQWSTRATAHAAAPTTAHMHLSFGWVHPVIPIAVTLLIVAAVIGIAVVAARRWMWLIDGFLPLEHTAAWVVASAVAFLGGAAAVAWAVT